MAKRYSLLIRSLVFATCAVFVSYGAAQTIAVGGKLLAISINVGGALILGIVIALTSPIIRDFIYRTRIFPFCTGSYAWIQFAESVYSDRPGFSVTETLSNVMSFFIFLSVLTIVQILFNWRSS